MDKNVKERLARLAEALKAKKALLLLLLAGLVILMLPTGGGGKEQAQPEASGERTGAPDGLEARLEELLSQIDGAGRVRVLLTLRDDGERVLARDTRSTQEAGGRTESESSAVTVSGGSGRTEEVEVSYRYPVYLGAVVCAEGAGSAQIRLELTEAVKAATGLGAEAIKIVKMGVTP